MAEETVSVKGRTPLRRFARHQWNATRHLSQALASLVPAETRAHSRAAAREWLLSLRVLLDEAMERLGEEAPGGQPQPPKTKVKVQVD